MALLVGAGTVLAVSTNNLPQSAASLRDLVPEDAMIRRRVAAAFLRALLNRVNGTNR